MSGQTGPDTPPPLPGNSRRVETSELKQSRATPPGKPGWLRRWFWAPVNQNENWAQTVFRVLGNLFRIALTVCVLFFAVGVSLIAFSSARENRPDWFGSSYLKEWCDDQYNNEYYKHERSEELCVERWAELDADREAELASRPQNSVLVTIEPSFLDPGSKNIADGCSEDYPFAIVFRNNSDMAMTETWIDVSVREKGTTKVLRFLGPKSRLQRVVPSDAWLDAEDSKRLRVETIILPNSTYGFCRKFPPETFLNFDPEASYVFKVALSEDTQFVEPEDWMYEELGVSR